MDEKPVLSCSVLAARASGHTITTLEGLRGEAAEFGAFIADQGAEQCLSLIHISIPKTLVRYLVAYEADRTLGELSDVLQDVLDTCLLYTSRCV